MQILLLIGVAVVIGSFSLMAIFSNMKEYSADLAVVNNMVFGTKKVMFFSSVNGVSNDVDTTDIGVKPSEILTESNVTTDEKTSLDKLLFAVKNYYASNPAGAYPQCADLDQKIISTAECEEISSKSFKVATFNKSGANANFSGKEYIASAIASKTGSYGANTENIYRSGLPTFRGAEKLAAQKDKKQSVEYKKVEDFVKKTVFYNSTASDENCIISAMQVASRYAAADPYAASYLMGYIEKNHKVASPTAAFATAKTAAINFILEKATDKEAVSMAGTGATEANTTVISSGYSRLRNTMLSSGVPLNSIPIESSYQNSVIQKFQTIR